MKKSEIKALIFIVFIIILFLINSFFTKIFTDYGIVAFLIFMVGIAWLLFGLSKDKSRYNKDVCLSIVIYVVLYYLLIYLIGFFTGFNFNVYDTSIVGIVKNIAPIILTIALSEFLRYMLISRFKDNTFLLILSVIAFVLVDVTFTFRTINYKDFGSILESFGLFILPSISVGVLCTYLCIKTSYKATILYRLLTTLPLYIISIIPDFGNYIWSVLNVSIPIIFLIIEYNFFKKNEHIFKRIILKANAYKKNKITLIINIIVIVFLFILVGLTCGLFKYQLVVIATGSMQPYVYRGDTVLVKKIDDNQKKNLNIGEILVYYREDRIICHRIYNKVESGGYIFYQTKGDNNNDPDNYLIELHEIIGTTNHKVKYIGLPTIWLAEIFE